jgi:hypothetical protein
LKSAGFSLQSGRETISRILRLVAGLATLVVAILILASTAWITGLPRETCYKETTSQLRANVA